MGPLFVFKPGAWGEDADFEVPGWECPLLSSLRKWYPELSRWPDFPLLTSWGAYSQDIYAVQMVDWLEDRAPGFLAYLYVRALAPSFSFGGTGLYDRDVEALGAEAPWLTCAPLPDWASTR
jgi:hypothetical protein